MFASIFISVRFKFNNSKLSLDKYPSDDDLDSQVPLDSQQFISTLEKVKKKILN